jgi:hypothetical protein
LAYRNPWKVMTLPALADCCLQSREGFFADRGSFSGAPD